MNLQLLNNKICFNISSVSTGLRPHEEATVRHRQEIGTRLYALALDYHRTMTNQGNVRRHQSDRQRSKTNEAGYQS